MRDKILYIIGAVALILLARDLYLITGFPPDRNQGAIFKIIFFHVPMAITALTCAMVAFVASILFLVTKKRMLATNATMAQVKAVIAIGTWKKIILKIAP